MATERPDAAALDRDVASPGTSEKPAFRLLPGAKQTFAGRR